METGRQEKEGDEALLRAFAEAHPGIELSYGGDGEILNVWRRASLKGKPICPVRNYGRCARHADPFKSVDLDKVRGERVVVCELLPKGPGPSFKCDALSEVQVKAADVTSALRMDVYVDGTKFCGNVIADGVICSSPFGATGYFSSVARTLFTSGIGFAFVAPTVGVSNLVLPFGHKVEVRPLRRAEAVVAADKETRRAVIEPGDSLLFYADPHRRAEFVGLEEFHCPECRRLRHGTTVVSQYFK